MSQRSPDYDDKTDEAGTPMQRPAAPTPVLEPNEARQGAPYHNVRRVLIVSLAAAIVALALIYLYFFAA